MEITRCDGLVLITVGEENVNELDFKGLCLNDVDLSNLDLAGVDFTGAELENANFSGAQLEGCIFDDCNLKGADFSRSKLCNSTFHNTIINQATFYKAEALSIQASESDFKCANFDYADVSQGSFLNCDMEGLSVYMTTFDGTDLSGSLCYGLRVGDTRLFECVTRGTRFRK